MIFFGISPSSWTQKTAASNLGRFTCHQFLEPGSTSAGRADPEPTDLFHEPQRSPENRHDPKPSPTATVATTTCHQEALQVIQAQFTSIRYGERLAEIGAVPSIGTVGDSYDNALAETVNGYYKAELIRGPARQGRPWKSVEDVELATLSWVHWHNHDRLSLGVPKVWCDVAYGDTWSLSASDPLGCGARGG